MNRLYVFVVLIFSISLNASEVRKPAVAGQFYPSDPGMLKLAIEQFLRSAPDARVENPVAIIVPHAGYIHSGQISADAYRQVMGRRYDTVIILGVNHTTAGFHGISLGDFSAFRTPLGSIPTDSEIASALIAQNKDCNRYPAVHVNEHSIEVQIPFIQFLFPKSKIVPVVIHPADYKMCVRFGQTLASVLKNRQTLIVISSDLSHYPSYAHAAGADRLTLEAIASLDTGRFAALMADLNVPNLGTRACGDAAIVAGLTAAKQLGATRAVITGYANSGDIPGGERARTVGYGAVVLDSSPQPSDTAALNKPGRSAKADPLSSLDKKSLLVYARDTIVRYLTTRTIPLARHLSTRMEWPQGAFVTLRKNGELRGCIGRIPPDLELGKTVGAMALEAAFHDPRFAPVQLSEIQNLEIEISVLSPLKRIAAYEEIVVGRDGVLMSKNGRSAVFLPQVAIENHWTRAEMLDNLCLKAGLSNGCWKHDAIFQTFQADVFGESQYQR